jgi:hypothetical protein
MGQQPNIELEIADLPRPRPAPAPARRWKPKRPGELGSPEEVPWGGAFGTTGPDTGFVYRLIQQRELVLVEGEDHHDAEAGVAGLAGARASYFGRAPTMRDVDVALTILGYSPEGLPDELVADLARERQNWLSNVGHDAARARALVTAVPIENLAAPLEDLRARMAAGERLILR